MKTKEMGVDDRVFQGFWKECKSQVAKGLNQNRALDSQLMEYSKKLALVSSEMVRFREFLRAIPIAVAIGYWMKGLAVDEFWSQRYLPQMIKLQEHGVIPFRNSNGSLVLLDYFMQHGHQEILEKIRCVDKWSLFEKEEIVQCYVQFSQSLARQTVGVIMGGLDPDRDRVRCKAVKYDAFIDFVQHLSERDSLIAKLLYFGAPSLDEILALKGKQVVADDFSIQFDNGLVVFPRHLIQDLMAYHKVNGGAKKLLFTNVRGEEVERAHLNQSFARACEKMSKKIKITPGSLLKMSNESIGESP